MRQNTEACLVILLFYFQDAVPVRTLSLEGWLLFLAAYF